MLIIKINQEDESGQHQIQSQTGKTECWFEGWIAVPENLEHKVWGCLGYCDLVIEGDTLIDIIPREAPETEETTASKIKALKAQLEATDYKIIKCSEYQLMGLELPYDIAELHAQRQALRDEINEMEEESNG